LRSIYRTPEEVPFEFLLEWFMEGEEAASRELTEQELQDMAATPLEDRLAWMEEAVTLIWARLAADYANNPRASVPRTMRGTVGE
jgi:hypothetical protein